MLKSIFILCLVLTGVASQAHPAHAKPLLGLSVCNQYSDTIYVSLGWRDAEGWHSRGWWTIDQQHCATMHVSADLIYYHWETVQQQNCMCPPAVGNGSGKATVMLNELAPGNSFDLRDANRAQSNMQLNAFNPDLFTQNGLSTATFGGVDKITIDPDGSADETLVLHQKIALLPLP